MWPPPISKESKKRAGGAGGNQNQGKIKSQVSGRWDSCGPPDYGLATSVPGSWGAAGAGVFFGGFRQIAKKKSQVLKRKLQIARGGGLRGKWKECAPPDRRRLFLGCGGGRALSIKRLVRAQKRTLRAIFERARRLYSFKKKSKLRCVPSSF